MQEYDWLTELYVQLDWINYNRKLCCRFDLKQSYRKRKHFPLPKKNLSKSKWYLKKFQMFTDVYENLIVYDESFNSYNSTYLCSVSLQPRYSKHLQDPPSTRGCPLSLYEQEKSSRL